jgi:hypothetical protein
VNGRGFAVLAALLAVTGCSQLKNGRCNVASDCTGPGRWMCNPDKVCMPVVPDAGMDAPRDATMDVSPPSCTDGKHPCTDKTKPFCDDKTGMCRGCLVAANDCTPDGGAPFCDGTDGGTGKCVQCLVTADCKDPAASACVANMCTPCTADSDCGNFPPGICKPGVATGDAAPPPGRCAGDSEVIYVSKTAKCNDPSGADAGGAADAGVGGTTSIPFCSMQPALNAITPDRNIIIVTGGVAAGTWKYANQAKGPLLIVGQNNAKIGSSGDPAFSLTSGKVTIRNVTFNSQFSTGITATGGTLTLDHVTLSMCAEGAILLDGASFDIRNTTITGNGTGMDDNGLITWSGIYVRTLPPTGPTTLNRVTIAGNPAAGLLCVDKITGTGVLAYGNGGAQISNGCMVNDCGMSDAGASMTCGAPM